MSLLEDIKAHKPDYGFDPSELTYDVDCVLVEDEMFDQSRWYVHHRAVFQRKTVRRNVNHQDPDIIDEFVAVDYTTPATELQEPDEDFTAYEVVPVEIVKTKYVEKS